MTKTEMIHTKQEGTEWTVAATQAQMTDEYTRRKEQRREERAEKKRRLEERNDALWNIVNRK